MQGSYLLSEYREVVGDGHQEKVYNYLVSTHRMIVVVGTYWCKFLCPIWMFSDRVLISSHITRTSSTSIDKSNRSAFSP